MADRSYSQPQPDYSQTFVTEPDSYASELQYTYAEQEDEYIEAPSAMYTTGFQEQNPWYEE